MYPVRQRGRRVQYHGMKRHHHLVGRDNDLLYAGRVARRLRYDLQIFILCRTRASSTGALSSTGSISSICDFSPMRQFVRACIAPVCKQRLQQRDGRLCAGYLPRRGSTRPRRQWAVEVADSCSNSDLAPVFPAGWPVHMRGSACAAIRFLPEKISPPPQHQRPPSASRIRDARRSCASDRWSRRSSPRTARRLAKVRAARLDRQVRSRYRQYPCTAANVIC